MWRQELQPFKEAISLGDVCDRYVKSGLSKPAFFKKYFPEPVDDQWQTQILEFDKINDDKGGRNV